jgi:hypothetical protein
MFYFLNMQIRKHAIETLSEMSLSSVEKINLARAHKVARWLEEGVHEIVIEHPLRPIEELVSQLGLEIACRLLWIQNQSHGVSGQKLTVPLGLLRCPSCATEVFKCGRFCNNCHRMISVDDRKALYLFPGTSITVKPRGAVETDLVVSLQNLGCAGCSGHPIPIGTNSTCCSCNRVVYNTDYRLRLADAIQGATIKVDIKDVFGDEIANCETWD